MESVTIEDVCKKDFEVFCDLWNYDKTKDEFGFYANSLTQRCFDSFSAGWRESRKALVVELPDFFVSGIDAAVYRDDVIEALDAAGVAYK